MEKENTQSLIFLGDWFLWFSDRLSIIEPKANQSSLLLWTQRSRCFKQQGVDSWQTFWAGVIKIPDLLPFSQISTKQNTNQGVVQEIVEMKVEQRYFSECSMSMLDPQINSFCHALNQESELLSHTWCMWTDTFRHNCHRRDWRWQIIRWQFVFLVNDMTVKLWRKDRAE